MVTHDFLDIQYIWYTVKSYTIYLFAPAGGVDAEYAGDEDAELEEDDGGPGGHDHGQGRAHHVSLAVLPGCDVYWNRIQFTGCLRNYRKSIL